MGRSVTIGGIIVLSDPVVPPPTGRSGIDTSVGVDKSTVMISLAGLSSVVGFVGNVGGGNVTGNVGNDIGSEKIGPVVNSPEVKNSFNRQKWHENASKIPYFITE